jgi:hypothetical protein
MKGPSASIVYAGLERATLSGDPIFIGNAGLTVHAPRRLPNQNRSHLHRSHFARVTAVAIKRLVDRLRSHAPLNVDSSGKSDTTVDAPRACELMDDRRFGIARIYRRDVSVFATPTSIKRMSATALPLPV